MSTSFNWKIAGQAGEGVMVAGKLLAKAMKRHGWHAFNYLEYPSLIRGSHQTAQVYASLEKIHCQRRYLDLLINLNQDGFTIHKDEITENTVIVYNADAGELDLTKYPWVNKDKLYSIPLYKTAKECCQSQMVTNILTLGLSTYILGIDKDIFLQLIKDEFMDKGEEIVKKDVDAFLKGYELGSSYNVIRINEQVEKKQDDMLLLNGNEAVGMGAIAGGLQYYAAYPMTPATGLLHYLAAHQKEFGLVVKHTEDEIGAVNQAIGASVAGARAMVGTSGGGFALMVEGLAFAGVGEIPLVIHEAQRTGPASGLPTWTAQGDLQFVLHAGHGDFLRVVLTPGTVAQHFEYAKLALVLAEKYQIPVFILSDKYILESHQTFKKVDATHTNQRYSMYKDEELPEDDSYRRYKITDDGISIRAVPGQAHGLGLTNSYEHDEWGYATEEADMVNKQVAKRQRKLAGLMKDIPHIEKIGPEDAPVTFVGWGSTNNVLLDTVKEAQGKANALLITCMMPFRTDEFIELTKNSQKLIMVEGNASGQAEAFITGKTGVKFDDHVRRYDGRPFYVEDLLSLLK